MTSTRALNYLAAAWSPSSCVKRRTRRARTSSWAPATTRPSWHSRPCYSSSVVATVSRCSKATASSCIGSCRCGRGDDVFLDDLCSSKLDTFDRQDVARRYTTISNLTRRTQTCPLKCELLSNAFVYQDQELIERETVEIAERGLELDSGSPPKQME